MTGQGHYKCEVTQLRGAENTDSEWLSYCGFIYFCIDLTFFGRFGSAKQRQIKRGLKGHVPRVPPQGGIHK